MSRTAQTNLKIKNAGVALTAGAFTTLDLLSGISAVDSGGGIAGVTAAAGVAGTNIATETITPVTSGANVTLDLTTLSHTFVAIEVVFRNGQAATPVTDWSRSSNTITVVNADNTEIFQIQYTY